MREIEQIFLPPFFVTVSRTTNTQRHAHLLRFMGVNLSTEQSQYLFRPLPTDLEATETTYLMAQHPLDPRSPSSRSPFLYEKLVKVEENRKRKLLDPRSPSQRSPYLHQRLMQKKQQEADPRSPLPNRSPLVVNHSEKVCQILE